MCIKFKLIDINIHRYFKYFKFSLQSNKKMEYLNQTIVYLSQENKELKQKNAKIQNIYKQILKFQQKNQENHERSSHNLSQNDKKNLQSYKLEILIKEQQIRKLSQENTSLKSELNQIMLKFQEIQKESLQFMTKNRSLQHQLKKQKEKQIKTEEKQQKQLTANKKMYDQSLQEIKQQIQHQYKKKLIEKQYEIKSYSNKIRQLTKQLQDAKDQNNQFQKIINGLQDSQKYYQKSIQEYQTLLKTFQNSQICQKVQFMKNIQQLTKKNEELNQKYKLKTKKEYELLNRIDQMTFNQNLMKKQMQKVKKQCQQIQKQKQRQLLRQRSISKTALESLEAHKKYTTQELIKVKSREKHIQKSQKNLIHKVKQLQQKQNVPKSPIRLAQNSSLSLLNVTQPVISKKNRQQSTKSSNKTSSIKLNSKRHSQNDINSLSLIDERYKTRKSSEKNSVKQFQDDLSQDQLHNYSSIQLRDCFPSQKVYKKVQKNTKQSPKISQFDLDLNMNFNQNILSPEYDKISPFKGKAKRCYNLQQSSSYLKNANNKKGKSGLQLDTELIQKQNNHRSLKLSDLQTPSFQSGKFNFKNHLDFIKNQKNISQISKHNSCEQEKHKKKVMIKSKK